MLHSLVSHCGAVQYVMSSCRVSLPCSAVWCGMMWRICCIMLSPLISHHVWCDVCVVSSCHIVPQCAVCGMVFLLCPCSSRFDTMQCGASQCCIVSAGGVASSHFGVVVCCLMVYPMRCIACDYLICSVVLSSHTVVRFGVCCSACLVSSYAMCSVHPFVGDRVPRGVGDVHLICVVLPCAVLQRLTPCVALCCLSACLTSYVWSAVQRLRHSCSSSLTPCLVL